MLSPPSIPEAEPWIKTFMLEKEKEVTGIYITGHPLDDYKMELENYTNCNLTQAAGSVGIEIKAAGIVSKAMHGVSQKNGLGYARITLQDYTGSFEMGLYNEDYEKYKNLLTEGQVLFINGQFKNYHKSDKTFFKLFDIRLLASVSEDLTKFLTLRIPLEKIDNEFVENLKKICKNYEGDHTLKMKVLNEEFNMDFSVSNMKIDVCSGLIEDIRAMGLSYKLN